MPTRGISGYAHEHAIAHRVALRVHMFTRAEWDTLHALRARYHQDADLSSARQQSHGDRLGPLGPAPVVDRTSPERLLWRAQLRAWLLRS